MRVAALLAALVTVGCDTLSERADVAAPCRAGENISALPLATYRSGPSGDGAPGFITLMHPDQIAVSGDDLFIADQGLGQLLRVQMASQRYTAVARLPGRVAGLFVDPFRKLYLAVPSVSAVLQVSPEGATERVIRDAANLGSPLDVVVDRAQSVFAVDGSDARVIVFDRLGQQTGSLGERLGTPNLFATTNALAVGPRGTYVLDSTSRKLHLFFHGRPQAVYDLGASARAPSAVAVDRWNRVFVLVHGPDRVLVLTDVMSDGPVEVSNLGMTLPILDLWVDDMGTLFLAEPGAVRSFRLSAPCAG